MKYIKQLGIILGIACIGKGMRYLIPLPIPGSIYGLLLLLTLLMLKVIKLDCVEQTGRFLIEIMPVMFISPAAGIIKSWEQIEGILIPLCVIIPVSTCLVMAVTGKVTDKIFSWKEGKGKDE